MIRNLVNRLKMLASDSAAALPKNAGPEVSFPDPAAWDQLDESARQRMLEDIYPQLKRIAQGHMRRERRDHTLQPTALVNEFYLILARQRDFTVNGRAHFLAVASRAMRRLLIDHARSHNAASNGGSAIRVQIDTVKLPDLGADFDILQTDELLNRLEREEPRMAQVVELKCFGGLTFSEIEQVLGIDQRTARRDWQVARAWLYGHLKKSNADAG